MILTLVAILAHLIYTLWKLLTGQRLGPGDERRLAGRGDRELLGIRDLDFDSVYAEARRLLAAADWPAATRYFYVAAILWLDRQGWIVFRPVEDESRLYRRVAGRTRPCKAGFRQLDRGFRVRSFTAASRRPSLRRATLPARLKVCWMSLSGAVAG